MYQLSAARYGKDNVRLLKVDRDPISNIHTVTEATVCALVEGDIDTSYTKADNSCVVATDSIKNTIYILAKQNPVNPPELFGAILANHFVGKYKHIHAAHIKIVTHRWTRYGVDGKPHPHSFLRDGTETRNVEVTCKEGSGIFIKSGIQNLTVLKSTGSAFHSFHRDEFTTLKETWDRILSTDVNATWEWRSFASLEDVKNGDCRFTKAWENARTITLRTFALDGSVSVQATMYKMADQILAAAPEVQHVEYSLPNKHYFEIDLSWHKGLQNTGKDAEVYAPQSDPNGLIKCRVSRVKAKY
ncbi:hypothetical protein BDZ91DRAFT_650900 [Kalaharituber pfeilii]|nr:hypothetical protein BDZ91DRAFT_650900 [Kalaharituber pfeilii]